MKTFTLLGALILFFNIVFAQNPESYIETKFNDEHNPCIDAKGYQEMEDEMLKNRKALGLDKVQNKGQLTTSLQWPLRVANGFSDCDYFYISAFVDQDNTSTFKDWNCGTRSYNGHRGVDIVPWPFIWDKMDNNEVEVIAAAAGTIIAKVDSNTDRVCNGVGGGSTSNNYITIQHEDGSSALYIHMKKGSFTTKKVGDKVAVGEYLGIVGSAGQSTGVHLHFEIRSDGTFANYVDPFAGSCNSKITKSLWAEQKPYEEPKIMKMSLHSSWPYMATCPVTVDTTYEKYEYTAKSGNQATFYTCSKHVKTGDTWQFKILNPDKTVFDSWSYTSTSNRNTSTLGWNKTLPTKPGVYTYEGVFKGVTCSKTFVIQSTLGLSDKETNSDLIALYPNPSKGSFYLKVDESNLSKGSVQLSIYDITGKLVYDESLLKVDNEIQTSLNKGMYTYTITSTSEELKTGKLLIE